MLLLGLPTAFPFLLRAADDVLVLTYTHRSERPRVERGGRFLATSDVFPGLSYLAFHLLVADRH